MDTAAVGSFKASDIELLNSLDYDTQGMIEREEYYILLPDIIVSKSCLDEYRKAPQTRMRKSVLLSEAYRTVLINDANLSYLKDELHRAMEAWNGLKNSGIKFVIDNSAYDAIAMRAEYDYDSAPPMACEQPSGGKHGKYASINMSKLGNIPTSYGQEYYLMMHLLGHVVGLEHIPSDNYLPTPPPQHIAGTANSDPASIMRTEADIIAGTYQWSGFSSMDKIDIPKIYPYSKPEYSIICKLNGSVVTGANLSLYKTYEFTVKYKHPSCPDPSYFIYIKQKDGYTLKNKQNGIVTVEFTKGGTFTLAVEVGNSRDQFKFEQTYVLPNPEPAVTSITCSPAGGGTSGTDLELYKTYEFTASYSHLSCPTPEYEIIIKPDSGYVMQRIKNGVVSVKFMRSGPFTLTAKVTNAEGTPEIKKTYTLPNPPAATGSITFTPDAEGDIFKNILYAKQQYTLVAHYTHPSCPIPTYNISIKQSNGYTLIPGLPGTASVLFTTPGTYTIVVKITNASNQLPLECRQYEKTYIVNSQRRVRINGPSEIKLHEYYNFSLSYNDPALPNPQFDVVVKETCFNDPQHTLRVCLKIFDLKY